MLSAAAFTESRHQERWLLSENKTDARVLADTIIKQFVHADDHAQGASAAVRETAIELSQWLGPDGCSALLGRALQRATQRHQSLSNIKVETNSAPVLVGVEDSIATAGGATVTNGLIDTMVELFTLLVRMVGDDVTSKLVQRITTRDPDATHGEANL